MNSGGKLVVINWTKSFAKSNKLKYCETAAIGASLV